MDWTYDQGRFCRNFAKKTFDENLVASPPPPKLFHLDVLAGKLFPLCYVSLAVSHCSRAAVKAGGEERLLLRSNVKKRNNLQMAGLGFGKRRLIYRAAWGPANITGQCPGTPMAHIDEMISFRNTEKRNCLAEISRCLPACSANVVAANSSVVGRWRKRRDPQL